MRNHPWLRTVLVAAAIAMPLLAINRPAHGAIEFPALEIQSLSSDSGATASAAIGSTLTIDATALVILGSNGATLQDLPDTTFTLLAPRLDSRRFGPGTIGIGSLLSASFSQLTITAFPLGGGAAFGADITYTGGALVNVGEVGRIEGTLARNPATAPIDVAGAFSAPTVIAKLGPVAPVVPIPAVGWVFALGCAMLFARAQRVPANS